MTNLRLFDPGFSESFESMFRRMMRPLRFEKERLDDMDVRVDVTEKKASGSKAKRFKLE